MENQKLPNATAVLILGIASIVTCICYGIFGLMTGIIGLVLASKDLKLYRENPSLYTNYSNLNIGRILCIIGIILSVLWITYIIIAINMIGLDALQNPELLQERIRELFAQ